MPIPSLLLALALDAALPSTHLVLTFLPAASGRPALAPGVIDAAVREAADIWSPYRVVVDRTLPCASEPDEAVVLTVRSGATPAAAADARPVALGAINFLEDGTPASVVTVFLDRLQRLIAGERLGDVAQDRWPAEMRQRAVGRALGRVIAHEIGHYLLGLRGHRSTGLMRATPRAGELFNPSRNGFNLSASDVRLLARSAAR